MKLFKWLIPGFAVAVALAESEEEARAMLQAEALDRGIDFSFLEKGGKLVVFPLDKPLVVCAAQV